VLPIVSKKSDLGMVSHKCPAYYDECPASCGFVFQWHFALAQSWWMCRWTRGRGWKRKVMYAGSNRWSLLHDERDAEPSSQPQDLHQNVDSSLRGSTTVPWELAVLRGSNNTRNFLCIWNFWFRVDHRSSRDIFDFSVIDVISRVWLNAEIE
jgi:hypothetical protein